MRVRGLSAHGLPRPAPVAFRPAHVEYLAGPKKARKEGATMASPYRSGRGHEQEPHRARHRHHRDLLRDHLRHRLLLRPQGAATSDDILPRRPRRRLVRDRRLALRLEHLHRALHRPRRLGRDLGPRGRPLRVAGLPDPADPRLGVRAVLPAHRTCSRCRNSSSGASTARAACTSPSISILAYIFTKISVSSVRGRDRAASAWSAGIR